MKKKGKKKVASLRHCLLREYFATQLKIIADESDVDVCWFNEDFENRFICMDLVDTARGSVVEIEIGFKKRNPKNYCVDLRSMKDVEEVLAIWERYRARRVI